ncbi:MAG: hypothetical protein WA635_06090 [Gallionella sp.]
MDQRKPPLILMILGTLALVGVPLVFFIFGWHSVDVACERSGQIITCHIEESFAAGLYVRKVVATGVTGIGYETHHSRSSIGSMQTILTSNLAFDTSNDAVDITVIASNTADEAKKQLILAFRAWQDSATSQSFSHHASMIDIFGWLGAAGVAFWAWLLFSWPYYYWKKHKPSLQ